MISRITEEMREELADHFGTWESAVCANPQGLYGIGEYI